MDLLIIISTLFAILDNTKAARVMYIKSLNCCSFGLHELPPFIQQSWLAFAASLFAGSMSRWLIRLRQPCTKTRGLRGAAWALRPPRCSWEPCGIPRFPVRGENKPEDSISCPLCVPQRRWLMAINNISTGIKLLSSCRKVGQLEIVLP